MTKGYCDKFKNYFKLGLQAFQHHIKQMINRSSKYPERKSAEKHARSHFKDHFFFSQNDDNKKIALSCLYFPVFCKDNEFLAFKDENDESYVKCSSETSKEDWIKWCKFLKICSMTNVRPNGTIQTNKIARHLAQQKVSYQWWLMYSN